MKENGCRFRFNPGACDFFWQGKIARYCEEIPACAGITSGAVKPDPTAPYCAAVTADAPRTFFATYSANPLA